MGHLTQADRATTNSRAPSLLVRGYDMKRSPGWDSSNARISGYAGVVGGCFGAGGGCFLCRIAVP